MSAPDTSDTRVRTAAFAFLEEQVLLYGLEVPRAILQAGFDLDGKRVPLLGPQGIFKPRVLDEMPLSLMTAPPVPGKPRPYDDQVGADGLLRYRYRGNDPQHRDNVGLRLAMLRQAPLIYFDGITRGVYRPSWPVFVVGDDEEHLTFTVAIDDQEVTEPLDEPVGIADDRRAYVMRQTLYRLHQRRFRARVLRAYQNTCAVCRLRRQELLEATHILPDKHPYGEPSIPNGLALCMLHHKAYDRNILGIRPDYAVELRTDVREQKDGPMLVHGLQDFQGTTLTVPRETYLRPNREFLAERYDSFRRAS